MSANNEMEKMWKETVVAYFKALSHNQSTIKTNAESL
jgi:hypothetical protein